MKASLKLMNVSRRVPTGRGRPGALRCSVCVSHSGDGEHLFHAVDKMTNDVAFSPTRWMSAAGAIAAAAGREINSLIDAASLRRFIARGFLLPSATSTSGFPSSR